MIFLLMITLVSSAHAGAWSEDSNPFLIGPRFDAHLDALPLRAELPESLRPWSGPYWSDAKGSIGYRWQSRVKLWDYTPPTLAELQKMTFAEIAALSPAEKIDIVRGRYDYPTLALIRSYANPGDPSWKGACSGWSQSALNFHAPVPAARKNTDGIVVQFGAGDLEALLAFYYDFVAVSHDAVAPYDDRFVAQIGRKCRDDDRAETCRRDLNPGALHIVLANRIGRDGRGVIADFSEKRQVWQHPIFGYSADVRSERAPGKSSAPNAVREVRVHLSLSFSNYGDATWAEPLRREKSRGVDYWLELDESGKIVGGSYVSIGLGKVLDYLWVSGPLYFAHDYEILNEMLFPKFPISNRF